MVGTITFYITRRNRLHSFLSFFVFFLCSWFFFWLCYIGWFYWIVWLIFYYFLECSLNSSIFREMKRYQKDFSSWCAECSREKKERQRLSIAAAKSVKYFVISCVTSFMRDFFYLYALMAPVIVNIDSLSEHTSTFL